MSRLRKIFKGEETWDVIYNDQDQILGNYKKLSNLNATDPNNPSPNKTFKEDNQTNPANKTGVVLNFNNADRPSIPTVNRISNKLSNVSINTNKNLINIDNDNREETDVQDLFFNDEINEKDYENFDHIYDNITNDNKSVTNQSHSESFKYKFEKRNFIQAFGNSVNGESLHDEKSTKKMKLD